MRQSAGLRRGRADLGRKVAPLGLLIALAPVGLAAQDEARPTVAGKIETVTLEEAVQRAMLHSAQLAQALASVANAGSARLRATGSLLPTVGLSSGASVNSAERFDPNTQRVVSGSSDSYSAGVNANYQLFEGGRKYSELNRARAAEVEAEARLLTQRYAVIFQTNTLFVNALRQFDLAAVAEASVERAEQSLQITRARLQVGSATRSDTLRTRLELANARQTLLQARNQLRAGRFALGRQVGVSGPVAPEPPAVIDPAPLGLSEAEIVALAESASPAVQAARAASELARHRQASARSSFLPSLSASSNYSWANQERSFRGGSTSWSLRLSGSFQVFDGFARDLGLAQETENRRVALLAEEDARRGVRQEVDAALRALETQEQAIAIAEEARVVAQEDLRINQVRYEASAAPILEVVTSMVALSQAEANLVSARYDYVLARAELESIVGREL